MASSGLRLWSSLSGLVFVVLVVVGVFLLFDGPSDGSPSKMTAYYGSSSHRTHTNIGWILMGLGLFALIWFVAALRERVRESEQGTRSSPRSCSWAGRCTSRWPWPGSQLPTGSGR
jgi:Ni,Fe-hydrogenase I cytochrome b subunit